ncbi:hypothetical protein CEXT_446681, partial [Caerostris extrusa]
SDDLSAPSPSRQIAMVQQGWTVQSARKFNMVKDKTWGENEEREGEREKEGVGGCREMRLLRLQSQFVV